MPGMSARKMGKNPNRADKQKRTGNMHVSNAIAPGANVHEDGPLAQVRNLA